MIYTTTDLCALTWLGDTPERVSQLRDTWDEILDNLSATLDSKRLRDLLVERRTKFKEFESDVKAGGREDDRRAYQYV